MAPLGLIRRATGSGRLVGDGSTVGAFATVPACAQPASTEIETAARKQIHDLFMKSPPVQYLQVFHPYYMKSIRIARIVSIFASILLSACTGKINSRENHRK
jgi:hypothetical protein